MKVHNIAKGMALSVVIALIAGLLVLIGIIYYNSQPRGEIMKEMGGDMAEEGEAMMEEGKKMIKEGEAMMEEGKKMTDEGEAVMEEGKGVESDGEAMTEKGIEQTFKR